MKNIQVIFIAPDGKEISMISPCKNTRNRWEIYSYDILFECVQRFDTREEAEEKIYSYIGRDVHICTTYTGFL